MNKLRWDEADWSMGDFFEDMTDDELKDYIIKYGEDAPSSREDMIDLARILDESVKLWEHRGITRPMGRS